MKTTRHSTLDYLNTEQDIQEYLEALKLEGVSEKTIQRGLQIAEQARAKIASERLLHEIEKQDNATLLKINHLVSSLLLTRQAL